MPEPLDDHAEDGMVKLDDVGMVIKGCGCYEPAMKMESCENSISVQGGRTKKSSSSRARSLTSIFSD